MNCVHLMCVFDRTVAWLPLPRPGTGLTQLFDRTNDTSFLREAVFQKMRKWLERTDNFKQAKKKSLSSHLFAFDLVLLLYASEDLVHVGLEHHTTHDELVEDEVHLVHVEDQIKFAHILETLVQCLHEYLEWYRIQSWLVFMRTTNLVRKD